MPAGKVTDLHNEVDCACRVSFIENASALHCREVGHNLMNDELRAVFDRQGVDLANVVQAQTCRRQDEE